MSFVISPDMRLAAGRPGAQRSTKPSVATLKIISRTRVTWQMLDTGTREPGHVTLMKPLRRFNKWIILCSRALSPPQSSLRSIH